MQGCCRQGTPQHLQQSITPNRQYINTTVDRKVCEKVIFTVHQVCPLSATCTDLCNARSHDAHAHFRNQLDADPCLWIGRLQVIDQLKQTNKTS